MDTRGSGVRLVPNKSQMEKFLKRGLTQEQIVETWEAETGVKVSRSAIAMAVRRYNLKAGRHRPRYEDMLPWRVRVEHRQHPDARMLRLEARRRRGMALTEKEKRILTLWRLRLEEASAVVAYDPQTVDGFYWVYRREADDDLIRRPTPRKEASLED